jgi:hypothetical protein
MARCPECHEPVSQFAAGCALCGADLEAHRRTQAERRAARPSLPAVPSVPVPEGLVQVLLIGLVVVLMPIVGGILALLAANRTLTQEQGRRLALYALAVLAVALLISPQLRFGVLSLLT